MLNLRLLAAASLLVVTTHASATSFVFTTEWITDSFKSTGDTTSSSTKDDKVVRAAKDDAASFVASEGQIRGAHLEAAIQHIRGQQPQLQASDMDLAEAILTH